MAVVEADTQVLEEMLHMEEAPEPGAELVGKPIGGDDGGPAPLPAMVNSKSSAGWVTVYHTETGEPSVVNRNLLDFQLRKKLENGKRAFTLDKRQAPKPVRGRYRCLLHPKEREAWMDQEGLTQCAKANLTSRLQVRLHMQHRHKTEWQTIEERRRDEREARERAFQERLLAMAAQGPQPKGDGG